MTNLLVVYLIGKKFQSQGFPQQQLHTTNMDNKSELSLDRLTHFRATNQSIYSNHISSDSTKVINCRSQTLIKHQITFINFRSQIVINKTFPIINFRSLIVIKHDRDIIR